MKNKENAAVDGLLKKPKSKSYSKHQLALGREVEKEHTNNLKARDIISKNHLDENPKYYDPYHKDMEKRMDKAASPKVASVRWIKEYAKGNISEEQAKRIAQITGKEREISSLKGGLEHYVSRRMHPTYGDSVVKMNTPASNIANADNKWGFYKHIQNLQRSGKLNSIAPVQEIMPKARAFRMKYISPDSGKGPQLNRIKSKIEALRQRYIGGEKHLLNRSVNSMNIFTKAKHNMHAKDIAELKKRYPGTSDYDKPDNIVADKIVDLSPPMDTSATKEDIMAKIKSEGINIMDSPKKHEAQARRRGAEAMRKKANGDMMDYYGKHPKEFGEHLLSKKRDGTLGTGKLSKYGHKCLAKAIEKVKARHSKT